MNEFNINDIIMVEQRPLIYAQLEKIGEFIKEQLKDVDKLECNEENKQEVKKRRIEINNTLKILEDKRKDIKNQILEPYKNFEEKYEKECKNQLEDASNLLKSKIDFIENEQKRVKEEDLREFFTQYQQNYHLENIVNFENVGLNITLSASEKSLKEQIVAFCEQINNDIETILLEDNKDELLLEYKNNGFNYQKAKLTLLGKKKQLEELRKQQEIKLQEQEQEKKVEERVEEIVAPKEVIEEDEILEAAFTIKGTLSQIKALKQYMREMNIEYE